LYHGSNVEIDKIDLNKSYAKSGKITDKTRRKQWIKKAI
jgi:hypothetical protein